VKYDLFNQEPFEISIGNLLEKQPIEEVHVKPIPMQPNDVLVDLVTRVNFLECFCLKNHITFQKH